MTNDNMEGLKIFRRRYVHVRMPKVAYDNFLAKQQKMEGVLTKLTNRKMSIPMTRVFEVSSKMPITLNDDELFVIAKKRKK